MRRKMTDEFKKQLKTVVKEGKGFKTIDFYWLLGPYDAAWLVESENIDNLTRSLVELQDFFETTTMLTIPFETLTL